MTANRQPGSRMRPDRKQIRRAVATSTAIETGESVATIEKRLQAGVSRFRNIPLAKG